MPDPESTQPSASAIGTFGPDETFSPQTSGMSCEYWAELSATDPDGVSVDGLQEGDLLQILDITGICSFDDGKAGLIVSIIGAVATSAALVAGGDAWKTAVASMRKDLNKLGDPAKGGDKRDGYGRKIGSDDYGEKEGGIIVCLPHAGGMFYSGGTVKRKKSGGGGNSSKDGWFFPARSETPTQEWTIECPGVLRIGVFDGNYGDNAGSYEIKFKITRK